jgi:hypothetical protein
MESVGDIVHFRSRGGDLRVQFRLLRDVILQIYDRLWILQVCIHCIYIVSHVHCEYSLIRTAIFCALP